MKKLVLFVLLSATFWSCDNYFGEKTDLSFIEVPTYSNRAIAYVPIEPSFRGFVRPTNITIGFDELIYIVDEGTQEIVCYDEAANEQGRFFVPGLTFVTQDRRLNLLAIGTYDTIVNGVNYSLSAIYRINQYSATGYGLSSAKITKSIVHPFYFKNSFNLSDADVTFNNISIIGNEINPDRNNQYYVSRQGPSANNANQGPDNAIILSQTKTTIYHLFR